MRAALCVEAFVHLRTLYEAAVTGRFIRRYAGRDPELPRRFLGHVLTKYYDLNAAFSASADEEMRRYWQSIAVSSEQFPVTGTTHGRIRTSASRMGISSRSQLPMAVLVASQAVNRRPAQARAVRPGSRATPAASRAGRWAGRPCRTGGPADTALPVAGTLALLPASVAMAMRRPPARIGAQTRSQRRSRVTSAAAQWRRNTGSANQLARQRWEAKGRRVLRRASGA